jgi:hypothetical protein
LRLRRAFPSYDIAGLYDLELKVAYNKPVTEDTGLLRPGVSCFRSVKGWRSPRPKLTEGCEWSFIQIQERIIR